MEPLFALIDSTAKEVEDFFTTVAAGIEFFADVLIETADEAAEQIRVTLETEVEPQFNEWFVHPFLDLFTGLEGAIDDAASPITQTFTPWMNEHPACVGCQHYHGQMYGDTMFVCGMHPYGWEGETCPDHESLWHDRA